MKKYGILWAFSLCLGFAAQAAVNPIEYSGTDLVTGSPVQLDTRSKDSHWVLVFLSARCPCSSAHQSALAELAKEYGTKNFNFVGINANADEPLSEAKAFFSEARLPFPVLKDDQSRLANQLGALKTPHVFVFSKGELVFQGGMDDSHAASTAKKHFLKDALQALHEGKAPPMAHARTLGCEIQR